MTDDDLMRAIAEGDEAAFHVLYSRYSSVAINFFYRRVGDRQTAEDLYQELFLRIFRKAADYQPGNGFHRWFYTLAANLCHDHFRRQQVRLKSVARERDQAAATVEDDDADPALQVERQANVEEVRRALLRLPAAMREIVVMREYEGLRYDEIAVRLGVEAPTLRRRMFRAVEQLRRLLAPSWTSGQDSKSRRMSISWSEIEAESRKADRVT